MKNDSKIQKKGGHMAHPLSKQKRGNTTTEQIYIIFSVHPPPIVMFRPKFHRMQSNNRPN